MANKLKDLFEGEKTERIYGTIRFEDPESCKKFKDICISINFINKNEEKKATERSLLSMMLVDRCNRYDTKKKMIFEAKYPAVNAWLTFFGISEQSRFSNFDFRNVRQQVLSEEGTKFLEITGLILNISDTAMNVPAVEAEIFDSEGRKTESKVIYPQERLLRPKESVSFRMRVLLMDNDSSEAELRFIQNKELSK